MPKKKETATETDTPATPPEAPEAPKSEPQLEKRKTIRFLQCKFTHDELFDFGTKLAEKNQERDRVEADKAIVVKQYGAKLAELDAQIAQFSTNIQQKYEYRNVQCIETFGVPSRESKTVVRTDTGETVEITKLSPDEMQMQMKFEKEQEEKAKAEADAAQPGLPLPADKGEEG